MSNKIIIVQGRGSIGVRHANNLIQLGYQPVFLRKKIYKSKIPNDNLNVKEFTDFDDVIKLKPFAAIIATPTVMHPKNALNFLKNNIPVYIEKPLGFDIPKKDLDLLSKYSKKVLIHGGFNFLYLEEIQQLKKKINSLRNNINFAEIVCHTNAKKWHPWEDPLTSYAFRKELGGGVIHTCSHEVNFLINFFPKAKLKKKKNIFKNKVCISSKSKFSENRIKIDLDLDFENNKIKRYIKIYLNNGKYINFRFNRYNESRLKDKSCFNSIKNFIYCVEKKKKLLISSFEDAKKTYTLCEKIINEK